MDGRSAGPLSGSTANSDARLTLSFKSARQHIAVVSGDSYGTPAIERSATGPLLSGCRPTAENVARLSDSIGFAPCKRLGFGRGANAPTNAAQ